MKPCESCGGTGRVEEPRGSLLTRLDVAFMEHGPVSPVVIVVSQRDLDEFMAILASENMDIGRGARFVAHNPNDLARYRGVLITAANCFRGYRNVLEVA